MGIKDLWTLLNPYCVRKPLHDLQGKTVAIDLAGWICESLCVVDYEVHARFYLRNLFFRTCYLLLLGITPVFVLEGKAPELKHQMIAKRNQIQFRGAKPRQNAPTDTQERLQGAAAAATVQPNKNKGRTRFNYVLKQCEDLIRSMGLQCVQGPGEAEAFCAHLNACGLVDGVISQDSDCFAYGARRVYRNFSLSMQGTAGSIGGSIDIYDLDIVEKTMDFGRNKIIVMALLCGCDYCPEGVGGVGRDAVQKLFTMYSESNILERIQQWRKNNEKFTELEMKVDDKRLCVNCGHNGRVQSHSKSGCGQCKMNVGCDSSLWKEKRLSLKSELQIRKKAMINEDFPSQEIIDEFMQDPIDMTALQLGWFQPNLVKFVKMMGKLIQWDEIYCFQKILPLLTRWQLFHMGDDENVMNHTLRGSVQPDFIKKKRAPKGVPSVEIVWKDESHCFDGLIPTDQLKLFYSAHKEKSEIESFQLLWSTIEPIDLFEKAYPDLIRQFNESKVKGKTKKSKKATATAETVKVRKPKGHQILPHIDANANVAADNRMVKTKRSKECAGTVNGEKKTHDRLQSIDQFFRKECTKSIYSSPKIQTTTKPMNLSAFAMDLEDSFGLMAIDDMNLSEIINEMVLRPPNLTEYRGKKLQYDQLEQHETDCGAVTAEMKSNDESIDEFDLIVMRKARKSMLARKATALMVNSSVNRFISDSSTPVISKRTRLSDSFKSRNDIEPNLSSLSNNDLKNQPNSTISTSFFAINPNDDDVDLFEKSIDFRNICNDGENDDDESTSDCGSEEDEEAKYSKNNSPSNVSRINNINSSCDFNEYDTFDRLVGIDGIL